MCLEAIESGCRYYSSNGLCGSVPFSSPVMLCICETLEVYIVKTTVTWYVGVKINQ